MPGKVKSCVDKVRAKLRKGTSVTKEQIMEMLTEVENQLSNGKTPDEILKQVQDVTQARKEKIKRVALLNKMSDFVKRKDHVEKILDLAVNDKPIKILGKTIYDPMEHAFTTIALNHEQHMHTIRNQFMNRLDSRLRDADLVEYAQNKANQPNLIRELKAQQVELGQEKPVKAVTGDEKAFQAARIINQSFEESLARKTSAGANTGYLAGRITAQMWSSSKFAEMSDKEFLEIFRDQLYNGQKATDAEWLNFKEEVIANHFVDVEENFEPLKVFNNSRKIELTEDFYIQHADNLMEGESLLERAFMEMARDARSITNLEFFGSNARKQYDDILNQVIAKTRGKAENTRGGKHVLNNQFYQQKLRDAMFGEMNRVDNRVLADVMGIARGGSAFSKLGSGLITSQLDWLTEAITRIMLKDGKSNIFSELGDAFDNFGKFMSSDKDAYRAELGGFNVVVETMYERLNETLRFADLEMAPGQTRLSRVKEVVTKANKINFIQQFTEMKQQASYLGSANIAFSHANKSMSEMGEYMNRTLRESGFEDAEWDFIRQYGTRTYRGKGYIDGVSLEELDLETMKKLVPDAKSDFALQKAKTKLITKWQTHLFKQAKQMTLVPSNVDRARLYQGTRAGTVWGETIRTATQFKQFSFAFATRFLFPLMRDNNGGTIAQFIGASFALGMLVTWTRDMLHNKTPRDFRKPQNLVPVVAQTFGFPFFDAATAVLSGQSRPGVVVKDLIGGPIFSDALETVERGYSLAAKALKGEADEDDFLAALGKTMGPALPFRSYPIAGPLFDGLLYDSFMESVDPGYIQAKEERFEERGQSQDLLQRITGDR